MFYCTGKTRFLIYGRSERELETLAIANVKSSFPFHWLRLDLQEYLSIQHIYTWKSPRKSFISVFSTAKVLRTPTPVTLKLETKIKDVLNPFFDAFRSLRRTKSVKLDWSIWVVKKVGKRFISIRNFDFKLNACIHNALKWIWFA